MTGLFAPKPRAFTPEPKKVLPLPDRAETEKARKLQDQRVKRTGRSSTILTERDTLA